MSTFLNISNGTLYIQGFLRQGDGSLSVGATKLVESGETFTGSNYYYRFTYDGMIANGVAAAVAAENAILERTVNDGLPFSDEAGNVPNYPLVYHEIIAPSATSEIDFETDLGSPALFMTIETDEDLSVYLNGNSNSRVDLVAGETLTFSNGELLLSSVTLSNEASGTGNATVQLIAAAIL